MDHLPVVIRIRISSRVFPMEIRGRISPVFSLGRIWVVGNEEMDNFPVVIRMMIIIPGNSQGNGEMDYPCYSEGIMGRRSERGGDLVYGNGGRRYHEGIRG